MTCDYSKLLSITFESRDSKRFLNGQICPPWQPRSQLALDQFGNNFENVSIMGRSLNCAIRRADHC
jgi:hypothetical protein